MKNPRGKFLLRKQYLLDLTDGKIKFGVVPEPLLWNFYRDGRASGLLAGPLLVALFSDLTEAPNPGTKFDIFDGEGRKLEVKTCTGNGVSFLPSDQKGKGRTKDLDAYDAVRDALHGYVVFDVRKCPKFAIVGMPTALTPDKGNFTVTQWGKFLEEQRWRKIVLSC